MSIIIIWSYIIYEFKCWLQAPGKKSYERSLIIHSTMHGAISIDYNIKEILNGGIIKSIMSTFNK